MGVNSTNGKILKGTGTIPIHYIAAGMLVLLFILTFIGSSNGTSSTVTEYMEMVTPKVQSINKVTVVENDSPLKSARRVVKTPHRNDTKTTNVKPSFDSKKPKTVPATPAKSTAHKINIDHKPYVEEGVLGSIWNRFVQTITF